MSDTVCSLIGLSDCRTACILTLSATFHCPSPNPEALLYYVPQAIHSVNPLSLSLSLSLPLYEGRGTTPLDDLRTSPPSQKPGASPALSNLSLNIRNHGHAIPATSLPPLLARPASAAAARLTARLATLAPILDALGRRLAGWRHGYTLGFPIHPTRAAAEGIHRRPRLHSPSLPILPGQAKERHHEHRCRLQQPEPQLTATQVEHP